jgi:hypothetical protein
MITDHLPIITTLDLSYYPTQSDTQFNYRHANWEHFAKTVQEKLDNMPILNNLTYDSTDDLKSAVNELFKILQEVAATQTPMTKPHPHLKCWWNKELTALRKRKNCESLRHYDWRGTPNHESHEEYQKISKEFATAIDNAKANHWKEWIEHIDGNDIWQVNKYMNTSPTGHNCQCIPHLNQPNSTKTLTNKEKADRLAQVFFPTPMDSLESMPTFTEHNPPAAPETTFTTFTAKRTEEVLRKLNPFKAPG